MNGKIDMKPKVYIKSALCLLLAAACFAISCSKTPEEKFTQALAAATEGDVAARADLEGLLINAAAEATFAENGIRCDGSVMWVAYDDEVRLLYPRDSRFPMLAPDMNLMRGADNANVVFSNGIELFVFAWSGDIVRRLTAGTEKEPVRGVTVLNGSVYYFSNLLTFLLVNVERWRVGTNDDMAVQPAVDVVHCLLSDTSFSSENKNPLAAVILVEFAIFVEEPAARDSLGYRVPRQL